MQNTLNVIQHNLLFIIESVFAWFLVAFAHVIGETFVIPLADIMPYVQFVVYLLAGCTSIVTMYKIYIDLKKKK